MTCNITNTPLYPEPLPLYQRERPDDALSIHSACPSYVSETPTYTSQAPPNPPSSSSLLYPFSPPAPRADPQNTASSTPRSRTPHQHPQHLRHTSESTSSARPTGLQPAPQFAPGFQNNRGRSATISSIPTISDLSVGSWSSTRSSHASRQYHAVARRRANQAASTTAILNSLSAIPPPLTPAATSPPAQSDSNNSSLAYHAESSSYPVDVNPGPTNPLEDPYLVGEEAAGRARAQRIYREMCLRGEETARYESRAWEFMLGQMADWEDRDRSWARFREQVGRTKLLGRRLGLRG